MVASEIRQPVSEKKVPFQEFADKIRGKGHRPYTLRNFERFCSYLKTEDGDPLQIEAFQRKILRDHFRGVTEEIVVIPKKNGKTTIFAALALFHLLVWPGAEVIIVASSEEQAGIMFRLAMEMVERSKVASHYDVRDGYKIVRLQGHKKGPRIRVLPADAKTADGVLPTLGLVDELHRHPNGDLYGVIRDGLDARNGQMITMSTAGLKLESPLGNLRRAAQKMETFKRRGTYSYARSEDSSFVLHEWSLTDKDDLDNLRTVKKANPASWQTFGKLARRKDSPSMTPGRWARFACGVWTEGEDPWVDPKAWDRLKVDIGRLQEGEPVWVAVATGLNPGYAVVAKRPDGAVAAFGEVLEGDVPLEVLENHLVALSDRYAIEQLTWGQIAFQRSAEMLEERGLPLVEFPYKPQRLSAASLTLKRLIQEQKIRHDGDEGMRAQVVAGQIKETEEGWRLVPSHNTRALIALAVACHQATQVPTKRKRAVGF